MKPLTTKSLERLLILASLLGLAGLATALVYVLYSTPYTMVLFMAGGITMIVTAILILAWVIVREVRSRLDSMKSRAFEAGETLCQQGEVAEFMYVITEGEVEFLAEEEGKQAIELGRLGPSDYFGDMAILSDTPYQATARALTEVRLLAIHRRDFRSVYAHLPGLRDRVLRQQADKAKGVEIALGEGRG